MLRLIFRASAVGFFFLAFAGVAKSADIKATRGLADLSTDTKYQEICRQIRTAADDNGLPPNFFARVIWQESRFDPSSRSRAGALGIAQFMPSTALSRGLLDPFEPSDAIRESASYLRELNTTFGNLGLAAAAYNAGPGRLTRWMSGKSQLPTETRKYVQLVTGQSIADWSSGRAKWNNEGTSLDIPCPFLAGLPDNSVPAKQESISTSSNWLPWGVQLLGDWTQREVLASYEKLRRAHLSVLGDKDPMIVVAYGPSGMSKRFLARAGENTREDAERTCRQLRPEKVACFAVKTPTAEQAFARSQRYIRLMSYARAREPRDTGSSQTKSLVNH